MLPDCSGMLRQSAHLLPAKDSWRTRSWTVSQPQMGENPRALQYLACGSGFLPLWRPTQDSPPLLRGGSQVRENIPQDLRGAPATKKLPARAGDTCIFLLQEGPICLGAPKPVHLEPRLCNERSHSWRSPPTAVKSSPPTPAPKLEKA